MSKILFVAAEAVPFASTGGLGDVIGSLPEAIVKTDKTADVRVVLPYYDAVGEEYRAQMRLEAEFEVYYIYRGAAMRYLIVENDGVVITYK